MHPFIAPATQSIVDVPEEMREKALKLTADVLRKIDEVRRGLELPVEQLPIVIETYSKAVTALIAEAAREEHAKRTQRLPLTLRSETRDYQPMKVIPGKPFNVIIRPSVRTFRPEDLAITGDRSRWLVHDIVIGVRSQFAAKHGPASGIEFGPGGILEHLRLDTAQTAMDITVIIEYVGPEASGEVFEAAMIGLATDF